MPPLSNITQDNIKSEKANHGFSEDVCNTYIQHASQMHKKVLINSKIKAKQAIGKQIKNMDTS